MKKIAIFSVNSKYKIGGAETCINRMYDALKKNHNVVIISGERSVYEKYSKFDYSNITTIPLLNLKFFNYLGNFINYLLIYNFFKNNDYDLVIANCSTSIAAVNATLKKGKRAIYYVHEEFSLNRRPEYTQPKGLIKNVLRLIRKAVDYPFFLFHCSKNSQALQGASTVIANSKYISNEIYEQECIKPKIIFPFTKTRDKPVSESCNKNGYITMVGSGEVKGISTFLKIAKLIPNENFRVIGRSYTKKKVDNVTFLPFFDNVEDLYSSTKILLVPSIWQEAFGKVSIEASSYGVPVIVSNRGGLPETVCDKYLIINDYKNPKAWLKVIKEVSNQREIWSKRCREHAHLFDEKYDINKLLSLI